MPFGHSSVVDTHPPAQPSPAFSYSHSLVLGPIGQNLGQPRPIRSQAGSDAGGGSCPRACFSLTGHFGTGCLSTLSFTQHPRGEEAEAAERRSPACPTGCSRAPGICAPTVAERGWKCSTNQILALQVEEQPNPIRPLKFKHNRFRGVGVCAGLRAAAMNPQSALTPITQHSACWDQQPRGESAPGCAKSS